MTDTPGGHTWRTQNQFQGQNSMFLSSVVAVIGGRPSKSCFRCAGDEVSGELRRGPAVCWQRMMWRGPDWGWICVLLKAGRGQGCLYILFPPAGVRSLPEPLFAMALTRLRRQALFLVSAPPRQEKNFCGIFFGGKNGG